MTPADKPKFAATLTGLSQVKPGGKLTPEALEIYWLGLKDWSLEEFLSACVHLSQSVEFMPNPYHFEQLRRAAGQQAADEAWTAVLTCIRRGEYRDGKTVGGKADRVVRALGGYQSLGMRDSQSLHTFGEKRFRELWDEIGDQDYARQALPSVARLSGPQRVVPQIVRQS